MRKLDFEAMTFDELWLLHEEITKILSERITAEKLELEKRLAQLNPPEPIQDGTGSEPSSERPRRRYPRVPPKYCNPMEPTETWSGRGKQPRWLVAALQSGRKLEEFRIEDSEKTTDDNSAQHT
ncbi:H-NS histone family protein [Bradyrhizobium cenepequi]|uniref:H-NS histone family protein n=1 Tax=Bradyrhizobium cenepequi TaxID=2821403 RepID=UPI001CE35565|nr:H-NS histone family protein [Bradyrhizobium cenepequi]MCA6107176.1 H-NS histone family protein [Bradyrhizobium cenepequi]